MNIRMTKETKKKLFQAALFLLIMGLTFYAVFHNNSISSIWSYVIQLPLPYLMAAIIASIFFVSAEGCMIWYLLRSLGGKSGLLRCITYSFIGFFYSGITPSATGGQPMQLYYMKKDGNSLADSSVVLMSVALLYKLVLVVIGVLLLLLWQRPLMAYLGIYFPLYLLGLTLNVVLVVLLLGVMFAPGVMRKIMQGVERLLLSLRIWKPSAARQEKIDSFLSGYQDAVAFLLSHRKKICVVAFITFLQRLSLFFLTYIIYRGFAQEGTAMLSVIMLQASVYIAVDMLPIPGAQGISELMYQSVFAGVFSQGLLMPSLCVTRGISFYLMLLLSLCIVAVSRLGQLSLRRRSPKGKIPNKNHLC